MRVSLLPESRNAYVLHTMPFAADLTWTGIIGIVSTTPCPLWMAALLTTGATEDGDAETTAGEADDEIVAEAETSDCPLVPWERCNNVRWGPRHTSQVAFVVHCDRTWSLPRQSKQSLCFMRNEILSLWRILRNFLQFWKEWDNSQNKQGLSVADGTGSAGVFFSEGAATAAAEMLFFLPDDAIPLRSEMFTTAFPNQGFNLILSSYSRNSTNLPKVIGWPCWYRILSATRAQRSCKNMGSLLTISRKLVG